MSQLINCANSHNRSTSGVIEEDDTELTHDRTHCSETETTIYDNQAKKPTPIESTLLRVLLKHRGYLVTMPVLQKIFMMTTLIKLKQRAHCSYVQLATQASKAQHSNNSWFMVVWFSYGAQLSRNAYTRTRKRIYWCSNQSLVF